MKILEKAINEKVSFKSECTDVFTKIKNFVKEINNGYSYDEDVKYMNGKYQSATYEIYFEQDVKEVKKYPEDIDIINNCEKPLKNYISKLFKIFNLDTIPESTTKESAYSRTNFTQEYNFDYNDKRVYISLTIHNMCRKDRETDKNIIAFSCRNKIKITGKENKSALSFDEYPDIIPGVIFRNTFGYDMTLNEYYQVVHRSKNTIFTKKLQSNATGYLQGNEYPVPDSYNESGEEYKSLLKDGKQVKINKHICFLDVTKKYIKLQKEINELESKNSDPKIEAKINKLKEQRNKEAQKMSSDYNHLD